MVEKNKHLSKSRYLAGVRCKKLLWYEINVPDEIPQPDEATEETFRQGRLVGELAKQLYPDGIGIPRDDRKLQQSFSLTQEKLKQGKPLFEAGFQNGNTYAFVDVLEPTGEGVWNIVEVKNKSKVEDHHFEDVALQLFVCEKSGLKIQHCFLLLIDTDYVRRGKINLAELFFKEDVTTKVRELVARVGDRLEELVRTVMLPSAPEVKIGPHCLDPYECGLQEKCWAFVPQHSVLTLYNMRWDKRFTLMNDGHLALVELTEGIVSNEKQCIQIDCCKTGAPHIDKKEIQGFLKKLEHPLYFLDFETFSSPIPLFDGTKPYQQVPFQFSLHVQESLNAKAKHFSWLHEGTSDPRRLFLERLKSLLGEQGSIVVFNQTFEKRILRESCEFFPEYRSWEEKLETRIVDLLDPFRAFHYYHPDQIGSASIKAVLPALTGKNYNHLDIQDGGSASREFMRVTFGGVDETERQRVRKNLETYCELDSMGMVWLLEALNKLAK